MNESFTIFRRAPFLKLIIPFILGIYWADIYKMPQSLLLIILIITSAIIIVTARPLSFIAFRFPLLKAAPVYLSFFLLGWLVNTKVDYNEDHPGNTNLFEATILETPERRERSLRVLASVKAISNDRFSLMPGKTMIYFDTLTPLYPAGTRIVFSKNPTGIASTANPSSFDYKSYLLRKGISSQVFLTFSDHKALKGYNKRSFARLLRKAREHTIAILKKNFSDEKECGLAQALLIGYKEDLDKDLLRSYSITGVVHVIAISGLHLGLLYWLLSRFLGFVFYNRKLQWLNPIIVITFLWFFSFLAGAQPSVLRSAVMFSCIVLGEKISRSSPIINSLALSGFILLCIHPWWLWDIGFQLSYAAVLSIVIFQKPIYDLIFISNKLLDAIWKLISVTLAAQILTTPISIFHFHQFPTWFILSNLIAVPLSSLVLIGLIIVCVMSFMPQICLMVSNVVSWLIQIMNISIEHIEKLPLSSLGNLSIQPLQLICIYLGILYLSIWLRSRSAQSLITFLMLVTLFVSIRSLSVARGATQARLTIFNTSRQTIIGINRGENIIYISDKEISTQTDDWSLRPSRIERRITHYQYQKMPDQPFVIDFNHTKLWVGRKGFRASAEIENVIFLPLACRTQEIPDQLEGVELLIIPQNLHTACANQLKKMAKNRSTNIHDIQNDGAFEINLR